jgi:hypothetical protein
MKIQTTTGPPINLVFLNLTIQRLTKKMFGVTGPDRFKERQRIHSLLHFFQAAKTHEKVNLTPPVSCRMPNVQLL